MGAARVNICSLGATSARAPSLAWKRRWIAIGSVKLLVTRRAQSMRASERKQERQAERATATAKATATATTSTTATASTARQQQLAPVRPLSGHSIYQWRRRANRAKVT